jgi:hypothetical protein
MSHEGETNSRGQSDIAGSDNCNTHNVFKLPVNGPAMSYDSSGIMVFDDTMTNVIQSSSTNSQAKFVAELFALPFGNPIMLQ